MLNDDEFAEYELECKQELCAWDYAFRTGLSFDEAYFQLCTRARRGGVVRGAYSQLLQPGLRQAFREIQEQTQ